MSSYAKVCAANRVKTRSLLVLAALYVVIGLGLSIVSAVAGEPLGAFLGFLIVSCTIGGTVLLRAVWRLNAQAAALSDKLHSLASTTNRIERTAAEREKLLSDSHDQPSQMMDLAAIGKGSPSILTAAVLDQATYPRLVKAMEEHAEQPAHADDATPVPIAELPSTTTDDPASALRTEVGVPVVDETGIGPSAVAAAMQPEAASEVAAAVLRGEAAPRFASAELEAKAVPDSARTPGVSESRPNDGARPAESTGNGKHEATVEVEDPGPMSRVMMRRWKSAYREGDLAACREVFSVFEPIADADLVRSMREQLDEVVQRTERRLRLQFQQLVHEHRFEDALRVGDEMERVLPDRPIAQEFARIKPHLLRRTHAVSSTQ